MAVTWNEALPKGGEAFVTGDPDHPGIHTQTVNCIEELRTVVETVDGGLPVSSELMVGTAPAVADSAAADVSTLLEDFNALLLDLRNRGVLS